MKNYKLGFSVKGFVSFILVMIPNIIWMVIPAANDVLIGNSAVRPYDTVLSVSRWLMVITLIMIINTDVRVNKSKRLFAVSASVCLVIYYVSWAFYYLGIVNPWLFISMALFPVLYFILTDLWLKNYIAVIPSIVFGITHIGITCSNYL